jgi:hypothetical protein
MRWRVAQELKWLDSFLGHNPGPFLFSSAGLIVFFAAFTLYNLHESQSESFSIASLEQCNFNEPSLALGRATSTEFRAFLHRKLVIQRYFDCCLFATTLRNASLQRF